MTEKEKYPFRISIGWYVRILLYVLAAAGVTWYQYGNTSYIPEPVNTFVASDSNEESNKLATHVPFAQRVLKNGEPITVLAYEHNAFWVETKDGDRGLLYFAAVGDWKSICERKDIDKHRLDQQYFINIGKKEMEQQYLGRSFAENELNYWPALSCYHHGDTLYATYQMRVWNGTEARVPTVCYVNDTAVAIRSFHDAPFEGNKKWLKATPWAGWMYTTPFFHVHWDKPMITRPKVRLENWWWIFRIPVKIILMIFFVIIELYWRIIICNPIMILLLLVLPLHIFFRKWSNNSIVLLSLFLILISTYFYMPMFLIEHGGFMTIVIMIMVILVGAGMASLLIRERCEQCLNVGFIEVYKKTLNHTEYEKHKRSEKGEEVRRDSEITKDIEQLVDQNERVLAEREVAEHKTVWITYRYYEYEITTEKKYYDNHCACKICNNYTLRENEEVEEKEIDKQLVRTYLKTKRSFLESY